MQVKFKDLKFLKLIFGFYFNVFLGCTKIGLKIK